MKNLSKNLLSISILILVLIPVLSFAQQSGTPPSNPNGPQTGTPPSGTSYKITIPNPLRGDIDSIPKLLDVILNDVVMPIGAILAVLIIMYAGFLFVTARGDTAQIKKARDSLLYGAIGAAILLGAKLMAAVIQTTINQLK